MIDVTGRFLHERSTVSPGAVMRSLVALFLIVFIGVGVFLCVQNVESVNLTLLAWPVMAPLWLVVVAAYLFGMLSGWGFVGLLKQSWLKVTESRAR